MNKLIEFKRYKHTFDPYRQSLSLFFEYAGHNNIKVNQYIYNSDAFISYLERDSYNIEAYDLLSVKSFVLDSYSFFGLIRELLYEIYEKYQHTIDVIHYIDEIVGSIMLKQVDETDGLLEHAIDRLNEFFVGYQFRHYEDHVFDEKLINALENNIKTVITVHNDDVKGDSVKLASEYVKSDDPQLYELRVYNVGQANCSALIKYCDSNYSDYHVAVVFDFGFEKRYKANRKLSEMIMKIDLDTTIIISHFDSDHINNISKLPLMATNRWLFPEHEPKKEKANLLYHQLIKIATIKSGNPKVIYAYQTPHELSDYLTINQNTNGIHDIGFQSTRINAECIISSIHLNNVNVLIPADALYNDFPQDVFKYKYNYVLTPHHGCKYLSIDDYSIGDGRFDAIFKIVSSRPTTIVNSGKFGRVYKHSNIGHLSYYKNVVAFDSTSFYDDNGNECTFTYTRVPYDYYPIRFN